MKTHQLFVANIKCHGCENSIKKGLATIATISDITIDRETGHITFQADESALLSVKEKLNSMGYPETDENNLIHKAKSFVSCAIGRIDAAKETNQEV